MHIFWVNFIAIPRIQIPELCLMNEPLCVEIVDRLKEGKVYTKRLISYNKDKQHKKVGGGGVRCTGRRQERISTSLQLP